MIDPSTEVCVCNSLTAKEIAEFIKKNNIQTVEELLEQNELPIGDKCEACRDEGFYNDGINLPLILSLTHKGKI